MKTPIYILNIFFLILLSGKIHSQTFSRNYNSRSDTADILHTTIDLKISDFATKIIQGFCIHEIKILNSTPDLYFDLLGMNIDSVKLDQTILSYTYDDTLLHVTNAQGFSQGDTIHLSIWYHGEPQADPSGWGGFTYSGSYAYNLGVGFETNPHNFGRVWYPCFDSFRERATYTTRITTRQGDKAVCGGMLQSVILHPDSSRTWEWELSEPVPSYLVSVAVAPYTTVHQSFQGVNASVPVELHAVPADTTALKANFTNLDDCFQIFEQRFGPYRWEKVGFVLVPFNAGAMEHATNIAYPRTAGVSGGLSFEASLMAHELSHHWFGDLITCTTAEDMWLNEGWASYCSFIFSEGKYGRAQYDMDVRKNHASILQFTHIKEGGYRAVSGVPHDLTYGEHVYDKGADVVHTLRGYMGDSLFFSSLRQVLNDSAYSDISSVGFRDALEHASGLDLTSFFDNWVFAPGFSHFSVDSFSVSVGSVNFLSMVYVRQKLTGASVLHTQVPLDIRLYGANGEVYNEQVMMSGANGSFNLITPFPPVEVVIDPNEKISDAIVSETKSIVQTGNTPFADARFTLITNTLPDTALVRIEHHYCQPDTNGTPNGMVLSPNHYWSFHGVLPQGFSAEGIIVYDGRTSSYSGNYFLDNLLVIGPEDSLTLVYRPHAGIAWQVVPGLTHNIGNANDKSGGFRISQVLRGEYCLARKVGISGLRKEINQTNGLLVFPNPADSEVNVVFPQTIEKGSLSLLNAEGKELLYIPLHGAKNFLLPVKGYTPGNYFIRVSSNHLVQTSKIQINP